MENVKLSSNPGEGLTPKELIKKHLKDPNHHVTDEEMMNLKVGSAAEEASSIDSQTGILKDKIENKSDKDSLPNLFKVLG
ncbi:MAG TPA: hypothetical protein VF623_01085 [Segetibacter sp.]|jgi:hypothetical protein